jgi:hypothetical protein
MLINKIYKLYYNHRDDRVFIIPGELETNKFHYRTIFIWFIIKMSTYEIRKTSIFLKPAKFCLSPAVAGRVYFAGGLFGYFLVCQKVTKKRYCFIEDKNDPFQSGTEILLFKLNL